MIINREETHLSWVEVANSLPILINLGYVATFHKYGQNDMRTRVGIGTDTDSVLFSVIVDMPYKKFEQHLCAYLNAKNARILREKQENSVWRKLFRRAP